MYRLLVSPSPFKSSYVDGRVFKWYVSAWLAAVWYTVSWPASMVKIQKKEKE